MLYRVIIIITIFLAGCVQEETAKPLPIEFDREDACRVCGMITVDVPGAKAQIHYRDGKVDTFCCTLHMFSFYLQPDRPLNISVIYVNDMGKADHERPVGYWIDAKEAYYVYGGEVMGPHGESLPPFAVLEDAKGYIRKNGGKIVRFGEITAEMLKPVADMGDMGGHSHHSEMK